MVFDMRDITEFDSVYAYKEKLKVLESIGYKVDELNGINSEIVNLLNVIISNQNNFIKISEDIKIIRTTCTLIQWAIIISVVLVLI